MSYMYFSIVILTTSSAVYTCYAQFFRRGDQFRSRTMEFIYFINLIFIVALNVLFFVSGICLNSLVIISFWRSVQLRKKLCYFMIMVLSCCDLVVVLTNHPLMALIAMLRLTEKLNTYPSWVDISKRVGTIFIGLSLLALLVMNFDRYLATYYPIFHRTSVTKGKLLTLLVILIIIQLTLYLMSVNDIVISFPVLVLIYFIIISPPMLFINYKLFIIARKSRRNNGISPEMKRTFSLKNLSSCLLAVACFVVLSIPVFFYVGLRMTSKKQSLLDNADIAGLWCKTFASLNSTFNCLIFYWKNKILRAEGMKVIKGMKICQRVRSQSDRAEQSRNQ